MGTIAEKLTYLNTTKSKIRDSINLTGANIGTSDTFRSYASKLKKGYIDIINNGIDTLYNNFPKVSGIGSNLSLTPTYEAPMKLNEIQGDTSQENTPTPDTPVEIQSVTGLQNVEVCGKNLFDKNIITQGYIGADGSITSSNSYVTTDYIPIDSTISYSKTATNSPRIKLFDKNKNVITSSTYSDISSFGSSGTYTIPNANAKYIRFTIRTDSQGVDLNDVMFVKGTTVPTTYEPYKGNTYEVNLGKNIWSVGNKNVSWATNYVDVKNILNTLSEGTYSITLNFKVTEIVKEKTNNLYGFTFHNSNGHIYNKKNTNSNINVDDIFTFVYTFTISSSQVGNFTNAYFYGFGNDTDDVTAKSLMYDCQLEKGSQATSYSPYFTPIELNKIGDYKDSIKKSNGKNLFDGVVAQGEFNILGNINTTTIRNYSVNYIPVIPNENYVSNYNINRMCFYDKNKTFINRSSNYNFATFTIPSNAYYIRFDISTDYNASTMQIEKGSTATTYEPYGKVWYLEKQIGKVVLDGTENGWSYNDANAVFIIPDLVDYLRDGFIPYSNLLQGQNISAYNQLSANSISFLRSTTQNRIVIKNTNYTGVTAFKNWLNSNNVTVYYVLATPTYTEITNTELIEDLETLYTAKSQEGTTNISITSEDLEMILNVSALKGDA